MIEINGKRYVVPRPGGMRTFAYLQRIVPIAGRVANVILQLMHLAPDEFSKLSEMDVTEVLPLALPGIGEIFSGMPEGELERLARTLLGDPRTGAKPGDMSTCDTGNGVNVPLFGSPGGDVFDAVFQGHSMDVFKLLWHAIGVWYPDFFTLASAFKARGAKASPSTESSISPGSGQGSV